MGGSDIAGDSPPKGEGSNSRASNTNTGNVARGSGKSELAPAKFPWGAIIALAMGMLVYGVAESYGPVAAISGVIPSSYAFLGLSLPYVAGGLRRPSLRLLDGRRGEAEFLHVDGGNDTGRHNNIRVGRHQRCGLVVSFILIGMAAIGLETLSSP